MVEYAMPASHKELLQAILQELVLARDPEATFIEPEPEPEPEPKPRTGFE